MALDRQKLVGYLGGRGMGTTHIVLGDGAALTLWLETNGESMSDDDLIIDLYDQARALMRAGSMTMGVIGRYKPRRRIAKARAGMREG